MLNCIKVHLRLNSYIWSPLGLFKTDIKAIFNINIITLNFNNIWIMSTQFTTEEQTKMKI